VEKQREIQEYFDKLKFVKYSNLSQLARDQKNMKMSSDLSKIARRTMVGGSYNSWSALQSIPKEEKAFYQAFSDTQGERRQRILNMVPPYMKNYYMSAWNNADGEDSFDVNYQQASDLVGYFKEHNLPSSDWIGWSPEISLDQVKLKTVKNEAFDIHKFNLWPSNERQLDRQPFTPGIENINASSNDLTMLQNSMIENMNRFGLTNNRVFVNRTPSMENSYNMKIKFIKNQEEEHDEAMRHSLSFS
jgi:hypothetical protein